jgi:hypothetical protein
MEAKHTQSELHAAAESMLRVLEAALAKAKGGE